MWVEFWKWYYKSSVTFMITDLFLTSNLFVSCHVPLICDWCDMSLRNAYSSSTWCHLLSVHTFAWLKRFTNFVFVHWILWYRIIEYQSLFRSSSKTTPHPNSQTHYLFCLLGDLYIVLVQKYCHLGMYVMIEIHILLELEYTNKISWTLQTDRSLLHFLQCLNLSSINIKNHGIFQAKERKGFLKVNFKLFNKYHCFFWRCFSLHKLRKFIFNMAKTYLCRSSGIIMIMSSRI